MLQQLTIRNFALIDSIEVQFDKGLNIITGETGSGKSIIMDALEMLLGERADVKVLKNKEEKCVIEAEFDIKKYKLKFFFTGNEIDYADSTILRREINPQGKSRAFINDTPVTLAIMRELGDLLIDIHSQHQTLDIGKSVNQFDTLDSFAGLSELKEKYIEEFHSYKSAYEKLNDLKEMEKKSKIDLDYFTFQLQELNEAKLKEGETEEVEKELEILNNSEDIKSSLERASRILDEDNNGVLSLLKEVKNSLAKPAAIDPEIESIVKRIESTLIELKDISSETDLKNEKVIYDPERIAYLSERLNLLNTLLFKHREKEISGLIKLRDDLEQKVNGINSLDDQIEKAEKELNEAEERCRKSAEKLSGERKKNAPSLEKKVADILAKVAMPHAELKIELTPSKELNVNGNDTIRFLFRTNKGGDFLELNKVASGGEFSRLMLALQSILVSVKTLPSIIFDEIDTGVSGEVAHKMGEIMRAMGKSMQVFSITHLPQVAGKGNAHFKVYKETSKSSTHTRILQLNNDQRIEELARMLSGDKLSDAAMANARELMN